MQERYSEIKTNCHYNQLQKTGIQNGFFVQQFYVSWSAEKCKLFSVSVTNQAERPVYLLSLSWLTCRQLFSMGGNGKLDKNNKLNQIRWRTIKNFFSKI